MSRDVPGPGAPPQTSATPGAPEGPRLPMALRLPNPPAHFVGRDAEAQRLRELLDAGSVAVLTGPPGVGKTALALAALAERARSAPSLAPLAPAAPSMLVTVNTQRPGTLVARLLELIGRALALPPDWRVLGADPSLALATLIDLADSGPWTILLDDAHPDHEAELTELLVAARDYARASRWVLTAPRFGDAASSSAPAAALPGIALGPLAEPDLAALSRRAFAARSDEEHAAAARRAEGLPRRLLTEAPELDGAGADAAALSQAAAALAAFERPLRLEVVRAVTGGPSDTVLQALVRRGVVLSLPAGLWLRRGQAGSPWERPTPARAAELAAALEAREDDDARLEAVRLWFAADAPERAVALLDRCGEALCERGYATELWATIPADVDPASPAAAPLASWRAWTAFEWGEAAASDIDATSTPRDYLDAHLRARVHMARGAFDEARRAAEAAAALARTTREHDRAICRAARALFSAGRPADTLTCLEAVRDARDDVLVEVEVLRCEASAVLGRREDAAAASERLHALASTAPPAARLRALLGIARYHLLGQRVLDGERAVDAILSLRAERAADAVSGRTALEMAAAVAAIRARFGRLRELAARLLAFERAYPVRALFTRCYLVAADQWQRTPAEFRASAERLVSDSLASASAIAGDVACYALTLQEQAALNAGEPPPTPLAPPSPPPTSPAQGRSLELSRDAWRARWGTAPPPATTPGEGGPMEHVALAALARANHHLAEGRGDAAERELLEALPVIDRSGYAVHGFELRRALALACWMQGAWPQLGEIAAELRALAARHDAPRLSEEAEFFEEIAGGAAPPPELLERWAADDGAIGTRTRWARWLLGGSPAVDPVEARVLEGSVAAHGWCRAEPLTAAARTAGPWEAGAGLDHERRAVWDATGAVFDLSQRGVLWELLVALAARGGTATKEELVVAVWGVSEYHPLNHDNRLRVSVKKLRERLGAAGERLATEADGYSLSGAWRGLGGPG